MNTLENLDLVGAGRDIFVIQEKLISSGFSAFLPMQERWLRFATADERAEHAEFLRERAAEVLSSKKNTGTWNSPGDGYKSELLSAYRMELARGTFRFLHQKLGDLQRDGDAVAKEISENAKERVREQIRNESLRVGPVHGDISSAIDIAQAIRSASEIDGAIVSRAKRLGDYVVHHAYPIGNVGCVGMAITYPFRANDEFAILSWRPWFFAAPPGKVVGKHISKLEDCAQQLDANASIEGFGVYQVARSLEEVIHCARAYSAAGRAIVERALGTPE